MRPRNVLACVFVTFAHLADSQRNVLRVDNDNLDTPAMRAQAVKEAFEFAWDGYETYAFPNDELHPQSNKSSNAFNGWGASAVDALSTAILMESQDVVTTILKHIPTIDFSTSKSQVSLFETTIRYLGGILSGSDLLNGPYKHLAISDENTATLASQAYKLAYRLKFAFDTPSGVPANVLDFDTDTYDLTVSVGPATVGTLILEWTRLSDLVGNALFTSLTQRAEGYLLNPIYTPGVQKPAPGLLGEKLDVRTGTFLDSKGDWGGGSDSYYEYLIKMYIYDSKRFSTYKNKWLEVIKSSSEDRIESHPSSRPDLTFLAGWQGKTSDLRSSHLACFAGGNWILGGMVLNDQDLIDVGCRLVDSCAETYKATVTGIGPEAWSWDVKDSGHESAFFEQNGFDILSAGYKLRPEVLESLYYAYRATGNKKYQDISWEAFQAVNHTCRVGSGFSSITDVNAPDGGSFGDFQESYLFAEFFKYAWLIHAEDSLVHVGKLGEAQEWVFNTEGHPLKVRAVQ